MKRSESPERKLGVSGVAMQGCFVGDRTAFGPCPACGTDYSLTAPESDLEWWCYACPAAGGVLDLVLLAQHGGRVRDRGPQWVRSFELLQRFLAGEFVKIAPKPFSDGGAR
jgi:hypothetical protein